MTKPAGAPNFDLPSGPELAARNRRLTAAQEGWPGGALEACEAIESAHPSWHPSWSNAHSISGFERHAGYYAVRHGAASGERPVYGATPEALLAAIEAVRGRCPACGVQLDVSPGHDVPPHQIGGGGWCQARCSQQTV